VRRAVVVLAFVALSLLAYVLLFLAQSSGFESFSAGPVFLALLATGLLGGLSALGLTRLVASSEPPPVVPPVAALFEQAGLGTFEVDARLCVVNLSPSARQLLGIARHVEQGERFESVAAGLEHGAALHREVQRCAKLGECRLLLPGDLALVGTTERATGTEARYLFVVARLTAARPDAPARDTDKHALAVMSTELGATGRQIPAAEEGPGEALVANVGHELRTPLVSIRGYGELLRRGDLGEMSDAQLKALDTIIRNLDRLVAMIDNLLEYSRLSRHRESVKAGRFDLAQVGRDVLDMLRPRAVEAGISLRLRRLNDDNAPLSSSTPLFVYADQLKVAQVITNLLGNALKFTDAGGKVRLYLRDASARETERLEQRMSRARADQHRRSGDWPIVRRRGGWLLLRVQDTGCGIPKESIGRVFDRFFTRPGERPERTGTGLGLAITDEIVRLHDGLIEVNSEAGVGTVFSVWLPISEQVAAVEPAPISNITAIPPRIEPRAVPILVVDDEPDVAEFARLVLETAGYAVTIASTGAQTLAALARMRPALVLLDYTLPDTNGVELLERVRATEGLCHMPVVMVSARTDDAVRQRCAAAGAFGFLPKPYPIDDLTQLVASAIAAAEEPSAEPLGQVAEL